ncbi:MAG: serine/threonine protein kinase, partial [Chloroflexota bacterium]
KRPFINKMGRLFGSSRYMSPEEFELGATIDQRSTVFTMGRTAVNLLSDGTLNHELFRGSSTRFEVIQKACQPNPEDRFQSLQDFVEAWNH